MSQARHHQRLNAYIEEKRRKAGAATPVLADAPRKTATVDLAMQREARKAKFDAAGKFKVATKCQVCGYGNSPSALAFHHTGKKTDRISPAKASQRNKDAFIQEVATCCVVCHNCHSEIHNEGLESPPPMGIDQATKLFSMIYRSTRLAKNLHAH